MSRPLVFATCGSTVAPVLPHLARRYTLVVPSGAMADRLRLAGAHAVDQLEFLDADRLDAVARRAEALATHWRARARHTLATGVRWGGRDLGREVAAAFDDLLATHLPLVLIAHEIGRTLGASGRLAALVVHEDVTGPMRALLAAAAAHGVPSVHVPHGLYAEERLVDGDVHGTAHTDLIAAAGPAQRDWFVRRGVAAERIVVTGNPAWDGLQRLPRTGARALGLPPGPLATLATSWIGPENADHALLHAVCERRTTACLEAVRRIRADEPGLRLVVKLHPSAPESEEARLRALAAGVGVAIDRVLRDGLPEILAASDVLLSLPSTIVVEAVLAGTPVIVTEFDYDGGAALTGPAEAEPLAALLRRALGGWSASAEFAACRRAFLARYAGPADDRASERVAALVDELVLRAAGRRNGRTQGSDPVPRGERMTWARALLAAGDPATALAVLADEAPGGDAGDEALWLARAGLCLRLGRPEDAETCYRAALASGAGSASHTALGLLLVRRGAREEAERLLLEAARLDPGAAGAWCGLGVLAALAGESARAVALLQRALALDPSNADARSALAALGAGQPAHGGTA